VSAWCLLAGRIEKVLTEASSVQLALSINPDILEYVENIEHATQRVKESRLLYFPNINLNLNLSSFNSRGSVIMYNESLRFLVCQPVGKKNLYYSTRLSIWQSVYSGRRIKAANRLAEISMNKIKNEENIVKSKVINNVKVIFNDCLYSENC
jgi:outer membrane protein TolC